MHHLHQKGTDMTDSEHHAKTPSAKTGLFAVLAGLLPGSGTSASSFAAPPRRSASTLRCVSAALFLAVAIFLAATPPSVHADTAHPNELEVAEVHATRATFYTFSPTPTWTLEYSTTSQSGPWTLALSGNINQANKGVLTELTKLAPSTHYYARLVGVDEAGTTREGAAEFTTTTASSPVFNRPHALIAEVFQGAEKAIYSDGHLVISCPPQTGEISISSIFCPGPPAAPTSYEVTTEVYANAADTTYGFEYSTSKSTLEAGFGTLVLADSGSLTAAQEAKIATVHLEGLTPETTYYVRVVAENEKGKAASPPSAFTTHTGRAQARLTTPEWLNPTASSLHVRGLVSPNGFETHWRFEYAPAAADGSAPLEDSPSWAPGPAGTIPQAAYTEEGQPVEAEITGLASATSYYVRLRAENEPQVGQPAVSLSDSFPFQTSGPPTPDTFAVHALHGESTRLLGYLEPHNFGPNEVQTLTIEGAPTGGTFTLTSAGQTVAGTGAGDLTTGSRVITRVVLSSGQFVGGDPISGAGIPAGTTITSFNSFQNQIELSNTATATATAAPLTATLPRLPFDATHNEVGTALGSITGIVNTFVAGPPGGPYTVEFIGADGSANQPSLEAGPSALTPSGTLTVSTVRDGFSYPTKYSFEYLAESQFKADGETFGAGTESTPEATFEGKAPAVVAADLPPLTPGQTYLYRLTATNTTTGNPVVHGDAHTLTVPAEAPSVSEPLCPNQAFRTGPSAVLPDCRAYEQVTPHDKEGSEEPFHENGFTIENAGALVGEDGDHFEFDGQFVHWGSAGGSPYVFSRRPAGGWAMAAGTPQPEAGIDIHYTPQLFSPDLTDFAFAAGFNTGTNGSGTKSPDLEFKLGPPGGPYTTAAELPRAQVETDGGFAGNGARGGWLAASADGSKFLFGTQDRTLAGPSTLTPQGFDLYEYSAGEFHQANVITTAGVTTTIGHCGAEVARGGAEKQFNKSTATRHSLSADGSRFFFYAAPAECASTTEEGAPVRKPSPKLNLYLRTAGAETTDLGVLRFLAANPQGTEALLMARSAGTQEFLLYDTESHTSKPLFTMGAEEENEQGGTPSLIASEDLSTLYISSPQRLTPEAPPGGGLYRYDLTTETLHFVLPPGEAGPISSSGLIEVSYLSPDGRYAYFRADIPAVPGSSAPANSQGAGGLYRYDGVQDLLQCVSCASPFDPEPVEGGRLISHSSNSETQDATPRQEVASANGDYVFFVTYAALLPSDANGEFSPRSQESIRNDEGKEFGPSDDVYEWRRYGVDGCTHLQGCLALISSGGAGRIVGLLGTAHQGRDVFFFSAAQLGPNDNDGSLDVYDARIGGGEPPPARQVECEGDACSTPFAAPNDLTPSSSTFQGAGNVLGATLPEVKSKPKPKKKTKKKAKSKKRRKGSRAKRAVRRHHGGVK
jgi:hypothetical protein